MSTTDTTIRTHQSGTSEEDGATVGGEAQPVEVEVLVEEISIDGMCGVY